MTTLDNTSLITEIFPHYDEIVEFDYDTDDNTSRYLIDGYREYLFGVDLDDEANLDKVKLFDNAIYEYVTNNDFFKRVKNHFENAEAEKEYEELIDDINKFYNEYQDSLVSVIPNSRWV
jgi:hypothetical protein